MNTLLLKGAQNIMRVAFWARQHAPLLMTIGGGISTVVGVGLTVRATLHVDEVILEHEVAMKKIRATEERAEHGKLAPGVEYTEAMIKQDKFVQYRRTTWEMVKLYWPAATMHALALGLFLGSYGIMRKRYIGLVAAYNVLDASFKKYRVRVREQLGEGADLAFRHGTKRINSGKDEDGNETKEDFIVDINQVGVTSQYARWFGPETTRECFTDPERSLTFLLQLQAHFNKELQWKGHVFLNDVYRKLGFDDTTAGAVVGWRLPKDQPIEGDGYIDFGISDWHDLAQSDESIRQFVKTTDQDLGVGATLVDGWLLDFNVDGVIFDKM